MNGISINALTATILDIKKKINDNITIYRAPCLEMPRNGANHSRTMIEHNSKKRKYWNAADDGVEPTP